MSFGLSFALPAYPLHSGGGNNPFNQSGPTLDLTFAGVPTDLSDPNGYSLSTDFIVPQYQIAAQYSIWENDVGLVSKTFSQIITFTRASTATYFDATGTLQSAAINAPRFDYDPDTLAARGFLIEEARTNLLLQSEDFTTTWSAGASSVSANSIAAPDGTLSADNLVEDISTAAHNIFQNVTTVIGTVYTFSVFAKQSGRNIQLLFGGSDVTGDPFANFDLTNGTVSATGGSITATISNTGNGWYRCAVSVTAAVASSFGCVIGLINSTTAVRGVSYTGDGTSGAYIWGAQLEAGAFATSYIPTTTTALTRSADVASVNTLSPWFNATEGTLFAEGSPLVAPLPVAGVPMSFVSVNNEIALRFRPTQKGGASVIASSVVQVDTSSTGNYTTGNNKLAFAYAANNFASSLNGESAVIDTSGTVPTVTSMIIGSLSGTVNWTNGYLRRITYYPRRLSNAELVSITS